MKIKGIILSLIIGSTLLVGCGTKVSDDKAKAEAISKANAVSKPAKADTATSASKKN